jgi:hypothetical protein
MKNSTLGRHEDRESDLRAAPDFFFGGITASKGFCPPALLLDYAHGI